MQQIFYEMAQKFIEQKEQTPIVAEDPSKGYVLRQKWDYSDNSPLAYFDYRCDDLLPAKFIDGFKDWVQLCPMSPLGVTMAVIDNVEGIDVIRQFTPAPWGSGFSNRSTVSCIYHIPDEQNSESHIMIVTSLGNEKLEQKWTEQGLFGSDVLAMNFSYWQIFPVKND